MADRPIVLAMTGASGAAYGRRLLQVLLQAGREVHFTLSNAAATVIREELQIDVSLARFDLASFVAAPVERFRYWHMADLAAGIASGSFRTGGMAIAPCSMGTLGALASGNGTNLVHRAAEVHLKERRKLILVPRETPLSLIGLRNMTTLAEAGAVILPAMPGFYRNPKSVEDLVDFVVARICDQLEIDQSLIRPWGKQDR